MIDESALDYAVRRETTREERFYAAHVRMTAKTDAGLVVFPPLPDSKVKAICKAYLDEVRHRELIAAIKQRQGRSTYWQGRAG